MGALDESKDPNDILEIGGRECNLIKYYRLVTWFALEL